MAFHALAAAMDRVAVDALAAAQGAFRAADSLAGARATIGAVGAVRTEDTVGYNRVERAAAANYLAAFTRTDQSVGMNNVDRDAGAIYRRIFTATSGLKLFGYGAMEDLITIAPFLHRRT